MVENNQTQPKVERYQTEQVQLAQLASSLTILLVLLVVIKPLYRLSTSIEGLFLIFIDCTLQLVNSILTVINVLFVLVMIRYCAELNVECQAAIPEAIVDAFAIPMQLNGVVHDSFFGLLVIIAINRFNAIFFPFSYNRIWKPKNKKIFLLLDVLQAICSRIVFTVFDDYDNFIYFFAISYYSLWLVPSLVIYLMILIKFLCRRCNNLQTDVTPSELRQDRVRIAFICFLTVLPWTLAEFCNGMLELIITTFFVSTHSPPQGVITSQTMYYQITLQVPAQLSHVIGILVLNRQFRQLLGAHIRGGVQLLGKLFRLMKHSGAVHPSQPNNDIAPAVVARPAREAWPMQQT